MHSLENKTFVLRVRNATPTIRTPKAEIVLMVVIVIDKLISPPSSLHQKFDAFPPGQQPITNSPNRNKTSSKSR